jgi:hypothetical protein
MDKENVEYYTIEYYSSTKNNDIMSLARKQMEWEIIMLNEIN